MFCCSIPMIIHFVLIQVQYIFAILMHCFRWERCLRSKALQRQSMSSDLSEFIINLPSVFSISPKNFPRILIMPTILNFTNMYFHIKGYLFVILMGLTLVYLVAILKPIVRITNWLRSNIIDCYEHDNLNELTTCFLQM